MLTDILILPFLVPVVLALAWLARRAWGVQRSWLKWPGVALSSLLALVVGLVTALGAFGLYKLYAPHNLPTPIATAPAALEQIARGEHVALVACASCHSVSHELPMTGGRNMSADAGLPLGDIYPPNLTPAGHIGDMTDGELFRAIRAGVVDGNRATIMSTAGTRFLSDEDAWAVVAYLRHSQPVQNETPEFRPSLLLAVLSGAGMVNFDPPAAVAPVTAPAKAANAEYGRYVSAFMGCADCHGENMDGQAKPPAPRGTNLRVVMPSWTKGQFFIAMRTGIGPNGEPLKAVMPWQTTGKLDDVELEALYQYLHGLSPTASP